jgi:hypothetical protein
MKKPKFKTELCVRVDRDNGIDYHLVIGDPSHPGELDASDGDTVAVYGLLRVMTYRTNPRLDK